MSEVEKLFEEFKGRLVEVECECDDEKRAKCVMYPEYCDGTRKEIVDLVQLIDEGLNNKLLTDKDMRIEELEKENAELKLKLEALDGQTPWKDIKDKSEVIKQLTKAKELLTRFVMASVYFNGKETDLIAEADKFLEEFKEVSERQKKN